jgi:TolB protein
METDVENISMTRRTALRLGLSGAAMMAVSPALAQLQITVTGGNFTPMPIAIPNFASADAAFGAEVAQVVRNNLTNSGLFRLVDPAGYPAQVGDPNLTPDFPAWRSTGADAVIMADANRAGQIQSSLRLWDTTAGAQVTGKSYGTDASSWRRIAHIASDAVYTGLTGETGYFDSRVVFVAESGPRANRLRRLAIMDQDGANIRYLSDGAQQVLTPRMSPDGQLVAYMVLDGPTSSGIFIVNLASGQTQSIGRFGQMSFAPRFSPDGRRLVFSVTNGAVTNIYAMDLGGTQPQQLSTGSAIDTSPSYSPDGQRLAFESDRGGRPQIYVMSAAGVVAQG